MLEQVILDDLLDRTALRGAEVVGARAIAILRSEIASSE